MTFRNPELQRLLDSLKEASRSPSHEKPDSDVQANDLAFQSNVRGFSDANGRSFDGPPQATSNHDLTSQDNHVTPSNAHSNDLKVHQSSPGLIPPSQVHSRSVTPSAQVIPDSSSITTWPGAIRHVTKYIINDEKVTARIKHLIQEQHKHEEQWWTQREAIVAKHNGRADSNTKVADILKELGGLAVPMAKVDQAAEKNELDTFDRKVYKSLVSMTADFDGQLRKFGVPFYTIKHDLVISDTASGTDMPKDGRLDRGELRDLQGRMLQYLEDLLTED